MKTGEIIKISKKDMADPEVKEQAKQIQWVSLACSIDPVRESMGLQLIHVLKEDVIVATDGHRMHSCQNNLGLPVGLYALLQRGGNVYFERIDGRSYSPPDLLIAMRWKKDYEEAEGFHGGKIPESMSVYIYRVFRFTGKCFNVNYLMQAYRPFGNGQIMKHKENCEGSLKPCMILYDDGCFAYVMPLKV